MRATVNPGVCGIETKVTAKKKDRKTVSVEIETPCKYIQKLAEQVKDLDVNQEIFAKEQSPIYENFAKTGGHRTCPVPMAILKAVEAEAGLALPREVTVIIEKD